MDSPGRVVIEEFKKGYELNKLQRDVMAVVTDQGLKKLDKKKKMRELLNPVPQPVFDQWLEVARLVREYRTETQTERSTSYGHQEIQQLMFNLWSVNRDQGPDKKKKIWELLDTVPKPVFEHGWNEFLLSKLKLLSRGLVDNFEVMGSNLIDIYRDRRLIHPVSYRVKKYRVLKRDFLRERARLEGKYQNWFRDLYKERFENVNGEVREPNTKGGVPEFWLKAMKNNEVLAEEVEGFKAQLRYDFYIGKIIRDKIIPHAIAWFTKEALQKSSEFHDLEDFYYDGYSEDDMDECNGDDDDDE
ncbi:hypothetical protein ACLB2K_061856 [Fragaria x ananassa]